jgi:hypothetical protein
VLGPRWRSAQASLFLAPPGAPRGDEPGGGDLLALTLDLREPETECLSELRPHELPVYTSRRVALSGERRLLAWASAKLASVWGAVWFDPQADPLPTDVGDEVLDTWCAVALDGRVRVVERWADPADWASRPAAEVMSDLARELSAITRLPVPARPGATGLRFDFDLPLGRVRGWASGHVPHRSTPQLRLEALEDDGAAVDAVAERLTVPTARHVVWVRR